ncbi:MAG TPA: chemotaxis protein MotB [Peptococcaceae bacterium]|nr:chemotaxis protein MotB [Peptococcaceae bacterium]
MRFKKRRPHDDDGQNNDRWLLTYADMITLLMIFFIMMYVISSVNAEKFQKIAAAFGEAFDSETSSSLEDITLPELPELPDAEENGTGTDLSQLIQVKNELEEYLKEKKLENQVSIQMEGRGLVISLKDIVLFPSGSANLTPQAKKIIADIGVRLQSLPNYFRVEGHTDNVPINTRQYPSNWELSAARATNVVQELIVQCDIASERLSATGYGEYRPKTDNDSVEHRQMNRRVDILILRDIYKDVEPN